MDATAIESTFKAWIDAMPGAEPKLIVTGDVETRTGGWRVSLVRAVPQGINPAILILDVAAVAPTKPSTDALETHKVRHQEPARPGQFTDVMIRGGNPDFTIPVGTAH